MERELNYPIKYAVLELKEQGGWTFGYNDITIGFIASKCYVVGSSIKNHSNGESDISYDVVFPLKNISDFKFFLKLGMLYNEKHKVPLYDGFGKHYPVTIVSDLFDNYEEAKCAAGLKNDELKEESEQNEKLFLENLSVCQKFEDLVLRKTENMIITEDRVQIKCKKLKKIERRCDY